MNDGNSRNGPGSLRRPNEAEPTAPDEPPSLGFGSPPSELADRAELRRRSIREAPMHRLNKYTSMKTIRNTLMIGLSALAIATLWAADNEASKNDKAQFQGEWKMLSGARDGQAFSVDFMRDSKRVTKGDETTVTIQGQLLMKAKFTLDPSQRPKTIDYSITGGSYAGNTQLGIYELDGDKAKFCFSIPGKARPTDFTTSPNDGRTLSTWKREKK